MSDKFTLGRNPTLDEVRNYYAQEGFLSVLQDALRTRRVYMVIPQEKHWEPRSDRDLLALGTTEDLREKILQRIDEELGHLPGHGVPPQFPSFHQSTERWEDGQVGSADVCGVDFVAEADLATWRDCFRDAWTLLSVLEEEAVPHLAKFSGNRSLHLLIPFGGRGLWYRQFGESRAHGTKILRMPYSLNEDTGLVSLPLTSREAEVFRPWHASLQLVRFPDAWTQRTSEDARERVGQFVEIVEDRGEVERRIPPEPGMIIDRVREWSLEVLNRLDGAGKDEPILRLLRGDDLVTSEVLREVLQSGDSEERWLTAESFLLHGDDLSRKLLGALLKREDPYLRVTTVDVAVRFSDLASHHFFSCLTEERMGEEVRNIYLLGQSKVLRDKVLAEIETTPAQEASAAVRLACTVGIHSGDWTAAWAIVEQAKPSEEDERWQKRMTALQLMREISDNPWENPGHEGLAALGSDVVDLLLLGVTGLRRLVKLTFFRALCLLADERALDAYLDALGDSYRDKAKWATKALLCLGEASVVPLMDAACSDDPRLRRYAVRCLGHIGDERARDTIVEALSDSDDKTASQAARALRSMVSVEDIPVLREVVMKRPWSQEREGLQTLLALGEAGVQEVRRMAVEDRDPSCAAWLHRQGDPIGMDILLEAMDKDEITRRKAIMEVSEGPVDVRASDALIDMLPHLKYGSQEQVARALAVLGEGKGLDALLLLSQSDDRFDRKTVALTLGHWQEPRAVGRLIALLDDENNKVRRAAAEGLLQEGVYARGLLEERLAAGPGRHEQSLIEEILGTFDLSDRLEAGESMNQSIINASSLTHQARELIVNTFRERGTQEDFRVLTQGLLREKASEQWRAKLLIQGIGEPVREALQEFVASETDERALRFARDLLAALD